MKKIYALVLLVLSASWMSYAQEPASSAYFLDGYAFRHEFNPSFASARNYFSIPVLSNINVGVSSNMGISTFLYPYNGGLTTFMNSSAVNTEEFLAKLNRNNNLNVGVSTNLLSMGFWGKKGGFTTVGMKIKVDASANLPYDLFDFMKNVGAKSEYDISNLGLNFSSHLEIAVGHSRKIGDRLNVGAKIKFLVGLAAADLNIDRMKVTTSEDKWSISAVGGVRLYSGNGIVGIGSKENGELDFDSFSLDPIGAFRKNGVNGIVGGYGAALDLGASYEIIEGLTVSAAVLDLGFISWNNCINASTGDTSWEFAGFEDISLDEESENSIGNQISEIGKQFEGLVKFYKTSEGKANNMLACRVNAGVEYEMPFYRKLSVGALYSGRYRGAYSFNEGRLALTVSPTNWFSLSGSYGLSNAGSRFGGALNLHSSVFSLYLATDAIFWDVTAPLVEAGGISIGVPYKNLNIGLNFGLVINLSKRKDIVFDRY